MSEQTAWAVTSLTAQVREGREAPGRGTPQVRPSGWPVDHVVDLGDGLNSAKEALLSAVPDAEETIRSGVPGVPVRRPIPDPSLGLPDSIEETIEALHDVPNAVGARSVALAEDEVAYLEADANVSATSSGRRGE